MSSRLTAEELDATIARATRAFELSLMCDRAYVSRAAPSDPILSSFVRDSTRALEELRERRDLERLELERRKARYCGCTENGEFVLRSRCGIHRR